MLAGNLPHAGFVTIKGSALSRATGLLMKKADEPERLPDDHRVEGDVAAGPGQGQITDPDKPPCPRCGWHNTRLSHTITPVDTLLKKLSVRAFRCRTCGNRFRIFRRVKKS